MSISIVKKVNLNSDCLAKAFIEHKNLQLKKIIDELKKMKLETADEIEWVSGLGLRLSSENHPSTNEIHSKKTPKSVMDKFGLPELIDTNKIENKNLIKNNKLLTGIFYLSMALMTLELASRELDENNYNEFVSLTLLSVEVFAIYEAANREVEFSHLRAKFNAHRRHKETYDLKKQAIEYWRMNIDPKISNPKAADILVKVVPVSHRKLVEYVAEAKRENIHSAS